MFITYGDTFLPTPSSYDELYYEIIRMHQSFDNLYSMGKLSSFYFSLPISCDFWSMKGKDSKRFSPSCLVPLLGTEL